MEETRERVETEQAEQTAEAEVKTEKTEKKKQKKQDAELESMKRQLEEAKAAAAACEDKYMRMMAEYDNFRKRSVKEREGVYAEAYGDCITEILPILDHLGAASKSENLEGVRKGLEMTFRAFEDALGKMGITEIETKVFDPNLHNAVMHVEDEAYGEGEIVEVFQKGYKKGDRVLRFAMVKVAN